MNVVLLFERSLSGYIICLACTTALYIHDERQRAKVIQSKILFGERYRDLLAMFVSFLFDSFSQKERPLHFYCRHKTAESREITHAQRENP